MRDAVKPRTSLPWGGQQSSNSLGSKYETVMIYWRGAQRNSALFSEGNMAFQSVRVGPTTTGGRYSHVREAQMQRWHHRRAGALLITAALTVFVLSGALLAQVPSPGVVAPDQTPSHSDEILPRLLRRPDGEVLRMWQLSSDLRTGGGGILLALGSPGDTWKKLLELLPREPGVTALTLTWHSDR